MTTPTGTELTDPYVEQPPQEVYVPYGEEASGAPTIGAPQADAPEFANNTEERCAVVLLLDTSNSMNGAPIDLLNAAVRKFHSNLMEDPLIAAKVDIALVTFNHNIRYYDFTNATRFQPTQMQASGGTNLSFAINVAIDMVAKRKDTYRLNGVSYHRPWILLITDGYPEHDSHNELVAADQRIRQGDLGPRVLLLPHNLRRRQRHRS